MNPWSGTKDYSRLTSFSASEVVCKRSTIQLILTVPKALAGAQCAEGARRPGGEACKQGEASRRAPPGNQKGQNVLRRLIWRTPSARAFGHPVISYYLCNLWHPVQLTTPPSSKPLYIHSKSCGVANIFSPLIQHHGGPHHGPRARARPRGCWLVGGAERRGHRCTLASCGRPVSGAPNSY